MMSTKRLTLLRDSKSIISRALLSTTCNKYIHCTFSPTSSSSFSTSSLLLSSSPPQSFNNRKLFTTSINHNTINKSNLNNNIKNINRTLLFDNGQHQFITKRFLQIKSKSLIWNIISSGVTTVFGVASVVVLPLLGFSFDLIMSTIGPVGAILIANLWWKIYNYNKFYDIAMTEIQKHRNSIQSITRVPFQLPHIKECLFTKSKVTRQLANPVTKQPTEFTEKFFKVTFEVPDSVHGAAQIEVIGYKSPFNLVQNVQTGVGLWKRITSLFKLKKKKSKPFKSYILITNINLIEGNRLHNIFEVPDTVINSYINEQPSGSDEDGINIPSSGINQPTTSDYYDTKQVKEADIVKEKKFKK